MGAGVKARGHVAEHLVALLRGGQRPHLGIGVEPRADLDLLGLVRDPLDHLVVDVALDVQARAGIAALALVEEDAVGRARDCHVHVGILVEHLRALAAQFKRDLLEIARGGLHDQPADLGRAREGDLVDAVVGRERRARVAEPGHDVDHAGGQPGLEHQLTEPQRRERRLLGGLEYHGRAGGQCRAELPGRHQQWEVPRDDLPDDAHGLLARVGEHLRPGRGNGGDRDRVALDLRRPARHVMKQVGGQGDVRRLRDRQRLAVVERLEHGQLVSVPLDQIADAMDDLAALGRRHPAPARALVVKAPASRSNGKLDVLGCAVRHAPETLLSRRVERLEGLPARRLDPFAVDQQTAGRANEVLGLLSHALGSARNGLWRLRRVVRTGRRRVGHARLLTLAFGPDR